MYETEKWLVYEEVDFYEDVEILVEKLTKCQTQSRQFSLFSGEGFDGIYGIPAGGLVPAVYLHYRLKLPLMLAPTERTLVVDDIVDTGLTMSHYISKGNFTVGEFNLEVQHPLLLKAFSSRVFSSAECLTLARQTRFLHLILY